MSGVRKQIGLLFLGILFLLLPVKQVHAAEANQMDAAKDSVVQVVVEYVDDQGNIYVLKSGSGFLVNKKEVLTNYHLITLTDEEETAAAAYLSDVLGKKVSFQSSQEADEIAYQVGVVLVQDVVISTTVNEYSSKTMDLGILDLNDTINRSTAVLGDSDNLDNISEIYTLGYRDVAAMNAEETPLLSQSDLLSQQGVLNGVQQEADLAYIGHTAPISAGNSGGPTVDADGNVIGINVFRSDGGTGTYESLAINEVKKLLDSCEITYQESGLVSVSEPSPGSTEDVLTDTDTGLLDSYMVSLGMLNKNDYTSESFQELETALDSAQNIKTDKTATQEEIDAAVEQMKAAKDGLVEKSHVNWVLIGVITAVFLIIVGSLVLYILKLKGILWKKQEKDRLITLNEATAQDKIAIPKPRNSGGLTPLSAKQETFQETTVLNAGKVEEGTVVLGLSGSIGNAYLIRSSNTEKIMLNATEFILGKDRGRVNYCINDNPSVSRCHAKIEKKGMAYCVSDLQSTNYTYLNGKILMAGEEFELKEGDTIRLSNEEFSFHNI